jgi:hypothetical protein
MDFDLTEDQQALDSAFHQLADRHRELSVGGGAYLQINDAFAADLAASGFLDVAREEGFGALEAVLLVEALAKSPYALEAAASAIVVPQITDRQLPRPVILARTPLNTPLRYLGDKGTALIDTGKDIRVVDLAKARTAPVASSYAYPFGRFVDLDLKSAPVLEGADPEVFRQYWRLAIAAEIVGLMEPAIEMTVEHVRVRRQFGRPLGAFQVIQHRLAECRVLLDGARLLVREAAANGSPESAALAATYAQDAAAKVIQETHQFHGAIGLTLEYPLHYWTFRLRTLHGELGGASEQGVAAAELLWRAETPIPDTFIGQTVKTPAASTAPTRELADV